MCQSWGCVLKQTVKIRGLADKEIVLCYSRFYILFLKNFWITILVDSWFWRIIDWICWACAIFCSMPNLQAWTDGRTDGRMDRRMDRWTDESIWVGLVGNLSWSAESHNCCIFIYIPKLHHGGNFGVIGNFLFCTRAYACRCRYPFLVTAFFGWIVGYRVGRYWIKSHIFVSRST